MIRDLQPRARASFSQKSLQNLGINTYNPGEATAALRGALPRTHSIRKQRPLHEFNSRAGRNHISATVGLY